MHTVEHPPDQRVGTSLETNLPEEFIPQEIAGPFELRIESGIVIEATPQREHPSPGVLDRSGTNWLTDESLILRDQLGFALKPEQETDGPWVTWPSPKDGGFKTFPPTEDSVRFLEERFLTSETRLAIISGHMHGGKSEKAAIIAGLVAQRGLKAGVFVPPNARPKELESEWRRVLEAYPQVARRGITTPWEAIETAICQKLDFVVLDETGVWFLNYIGAHRGKSPEEQQAVVLEYKNRFLSAISEWLQEGQGKLIITHMKAFADLRGWPIHNELVDLVKSFADKGLAVYDEAYATCALTGRVARTSSLTTGIYWRAKAAGKEWLVHQLVPDLSRWPEAILPEYLALSPEIDRILRPKIWQQAGNLALVDFPDISLSGFDPNIN